MFTCCFEEKCGRIIWPLHIIERGRGQIGLGSLSYHIQDAAAMDAGWTVRIQTNRWNWLWIHHNRFPL